MIDQGRDDQFLSASQLLPDNLIAACSKKKIPVVFRLQQVSIELPHDEGEALHVGKSNYSIQYLGYICLHRNRGHFTNKEIDFFCCCTIVVFLPHDKSNVFFKVQQKILFFGCNTILFKLLLPFYLLNSVSSGVNNSFVNTELPVTGYFFSF